MQTVRITVIQAADDRGYSDGITTPSYLDRFQVFTISVDPVAKTVTPTLVDTRVMTNEKGQNFVGQTADFNFSGTDDSVRSGRSASGARRP